MGLRREGSNITGVEHVFVPFAKITPLATTLFYAGLATVSWICGSFAACLCALSALLFPCWIGHGDVDLGILCRLLMTVPCLCPHFCWIGHGDVDL